MTQHMEIKTMHPLIKVTLVIGIFCLFPQLIKADERQAQIQCQEDREMSQAIQYVRIVTHDDLATFIDTINNHNQAHNQRERNFWKATIQMAQKVYRLSIGYAPDKVGLAFEHGCFVRFSVMRPADAFTL